MRFQAPSRNSIPEERFFQPIFKDFAARLGLLVGPEWPDLARLNAELAGARHGQTGLPLQFVAQTPALLSDGLHYEARIWQKGQIATREQNWHDLFNALMWMERLPLKSAVNGAYLAELSAASVKQRTRAQAALTHFDEAGALVLVSDCGLLDAWDRHAWCELLFEDRARWVASARVLLFGHALLEHALEPDVRPVAKCLVVAVTESSSPAAVVEAVARAILAGGLLRDPQELRPLPLAGLPGWHAAANSPRFFDETPCFRAIRPGRRYPPAWVSDAGGLRLAGGLR